MASSSPTILPISNPQTVESQPPVATPAFRNFINNITENVRSGLSKRRPWSEILDRYAFSRPDSITAAAARLLSPHQSFLSSSSKLALQICRSSSSAVRSPRVKP